MGGQLHLIHNSIKNHLGSKFSDGTDCFGHFSESLKGRRFEARLGINVKEIDIPGLAVRLSDGTALAGKAIVIASGVRRRKLRVPGESEFFGKGIIDSGARFREQARGRRVAVVGGGDAALENAIILADHADRVYLIHRRDEFTAKPEFVESIRSNSNIEVLMNSVVQAFAGVDKLEFVDVFGTEKEQTRLRVDNAVIRIGVEPKTDFVSSAIDVDENGYLRVDHQGRTSAKLIYAIGDVANPVSPTISSAVGTAATAVKSIAKRIHTIK
jgi:thioredoxin reductase (NADPH)